MRGRAVGTIISLALSMAPAAAQQAGWTYSPYAGEGDRAAMGCAFDSTPEVHACVVVRCEDDFTVAVHIDTTRPGGDAGRWSLEVDGVSFDLTAVVVAGSAYGAKLDGDVGQLIGAIRNGSTLYFDPRDGAQVPRNGIGLSGSLHAINQALFFCAPRTALPRSADDSAEESTDPGGDG